VKVHQVLECGAALSRRSLGEGGRAAFSLCVADESNDRSSNQRCTENCLSAEALAEAGEFALAIG
jgi:hypothetical protein